jgi:hypothetical protein
LFNGINAWFEAARFSADIQSVVAMRLMRLASGGPLAAAEARRMVSEKLGALGAAQAAVIAAMATGASFEDAATKVYAPYRRRVRANHRRLVS